VRSIPQCPLLAEVVEKVGEALFWGTYLENGSLGWMVLEGHSANLRIEESSCSNSLMQTGPGTFSTASAKSRHQRRWSSE
jgi:hypothetical protein